MLLFMAMNKLCSIGGRSSLPFPPNWSTDEIQKCRKCSKWEPQINTRLRWILWLNAWSWKRILRKTVRTTRHQFFVSGKYVRHLQLRKIPWNSKKTSRVCARKANRSWKHEIVPDFVNRFPNICTFTNSLSGFTQSADLPQPSNHLWFPLWVFRTFWVSSVKRSFANSGSYNISSSIVNWIVLDEYPAIKLLTKKFWIELNYWFTCQ